MVDLFKDLTWKEYRGFVYMEAGTEATKSVSIHIICYFGASLYVRTINLVTLTYAFNKK